MTRAEQPGLFADADEHLALEPGAWLLRGFALQDAPELLDAIAQVAQAAPWRHMETAGGWRSQYRPAVPKVLTAPSGGSERSERGGLMSVAMTNCGDAGWLSDRRGYRYDAIDPLTGQPWPALPAAFVDLAVRAAHAAGFAGFQPDACLINRYQPGARLSLHQDRNEADFGAPIVSVSLGVPATFLWGGAERAQRPRRVPLVHGDVVVWGGPARLHFHGVDTLREAQHALTGPLRFNLTCRRALPPP
jgi:alkylated DNA repair protein (DNA oxidative demethylase)